MAEPLQLYLLVSDADDPTEFSTNVSALLMCVESGQFTVASSLAKSAVDVMVTARRSKDFQCVFDTAWDPLKSETAIIDHVILASEELQSYSGELSILFRGVDLSNYSNETDDIFRYRLQQALFAGRNKSLIVVAPAASIRVCLELLGMQAEQCPVLTAWNIFQAQKTAQCIWGYSTKVDLRTYLQEKNLLKDLKAPEPEVFVNNPSPAKVSINIPLPEKRPPPPPPPRDDEFIRLSTELQQSLNGLLKDQIHVRADPLESMLLNVTTAVGKLYNLFDEAEKRKRDTTESDQLKAEMTQQINGLRRQLDESRQKQQTDHASVRDNFATKKELQAAEQRCNELELQVKALRQEIKEAANNAQKLRDQEVPRPKDIPAENPPQKPLEVPRIPQQPPEKHEPRAEEAKAIAVEPVPEGPLLQILSLGRNVDGKLTATVVNRGAEEILGYLCATQQGAWKAYPPQPLSFVGENVIDMSEWAQLSPGQYEASVFNSVNNECVSNSFTFTIAEEQVYQPQPPQSEDADFEQCFVNRYITNMAEVQNYVLAYHGETGFQNFKKIACQWKNPSHDQLDIFLQTIVATNLQDEAEARQQLEASGFQL